jgi:transglutaminase-like putative cysteine protease
LHDPNGSPMLQVPGPTRESSSNKRLAALVLITCLVLIVAVASVAAVVTGGSGTRRTSQADTEYYYVPGPDVQNIQFTMTYKVHITGENSRVEFITAVPRTIERRQEVCVSYDPQPLEVFDDGESRYARFVITNPVADFDITLTGNAAIHRYDLATARSMEKPPPAAGLEKYLVDEMFLEKDSYKVKQVAEEIEGEKDIVVVKNIFEYIADEFSYWEGIASYGGAEDALRDEGGVCMDYADAMVSLCRAKGIPAKSASGIIVDKSLQGTEFLEQLHMWVEVYLQDYGWVPFDPTTGELGIDFFDSMYPYYFRYSDARNDQNLYLSAFYIYIEYGDPVEVDWQYEFTIIKPDIPGE